MRRDGAAEAGFTLVEVVIAMVVFIFGIIAVSNLFLVSSVSNQIGNLSTVTAAEASDILEQLKATKFTDLVPGGGDYTGDYAGFRAQFASVNASGDACTTSLIDCFERNVALPNIGTLRTRWIITSLGSGSVPMVHIVVRSEVISARLGKAVSGAEFQTFRSCTTSPDCISYTVPGI